MEPEDLVEAVRKQARAGDGWVKLVGDWIDRGAGDLAAVFPAAVLKDAVRAAHDEGARVTAHCFAEDTLDDMLDAGIDCIEHGTGLLPRHLPRFVEQGVPIVPTLINIATFPDIAAQAEAKFPRYAAHMRSLWERRSERILEAFEAGVSIYAGTDAGSVIRHGRIVDEIQALHAAGLPAAAALDAGSLVGARLARGGRHRRRRQRRRPGLRRGPPGPPRNPGRTTAHRAAGDEPPSMRNKLKLQVI